MARIDAFLQLGREQGGSDVHLTVGQPPLVRLDGQLTPIQYRSLSESETRDLVLEILTPAQRERLDEQGALDLSHEVEGLGRFRINACRHYGGVAAFCRVIPNEVPALASLGLPPVISHFAHLRSGLVLVTGTAGTGKSTTLAAMVNEINRDLSRNILTLEDPIEYLHPCRRSLVVQREVGTHVASFRDGLRSALREDPDVILVGELRDAQTVALALEAAETGHLVLGTLHTRGAAQVIDRIVDAHPSDNQSQVRHALADNLRAVVSQELLRASDGRGRRAAVEVLVMTFAIQQLVREGKTFQLPAAMTTGRRLGMQLMDQAMLALVRAGEVDADQAFLKAEDKWGFAPYVTRHELLQLTGGDRAA